MQSVYISLGSNIEREKNIRNGVQALREEFGELTLSPVYQTAAIGFDGDDFFNLVAGFHSNLSVQEIYEALREIENRCGRDRSSKRYAPRTLDIDLLLADTQCINSPGINLPRAEIATRAFVLAPLTDIAAQLVHPTLGITLAELWEKMQQKCSDEVQSIRQIDFAFNASSTATTTCPHPPQSPAR